MTDYQPYLVLIINILFLVGIGLGVGLAMHVVNKMLGRGKKENESEYR